MTLYPVVQGLSRPLFMRAYRVTLIGTERVPSQGPCILASNHESVLDGFFLALATRRPVHYMVRAELYRHPGLKQLLNGLGCFPVERSGDEGRAVERGRGLLERGELVGIFPQGTCLPYRRRPFRRGAARLALEARSPLVPVALIGVERSIQPRTHRIGFPRVTIVVGEPISDTGQEPTVEAATELTAQLEAAVTALREPYGEPDHAWYDR